MTRTFIKFLFRIYKYGLSPAFSVGFGIRCRYEESCSTYTERMIMEQGLLRGSWMGIKRILSCSPLTDLQLIHKRD